MENSKKLTIAEFYNGKSIFITGGMGFLGKVIVEKLLRSCSGIEKIFLLARSKKGKNVNDRLDEFINSPPMTLLREKNPKVFNKIIMIEGDVSEEKLGISEENLKLISENVSIFIHSAATINFNEPLKIAIKTNLQSVKEIMKMARNSKKLDALIHVSTAYTNWFEYDCAKGLVEEKIYTNEFKPNDIINLSQSMSQELLNKLTPSMLGKHTNTYTFTKNLAEQLIVNEGKDLPVAIIRPSMVLGSLKEPFPGWLDSWAGPTAYAYFLSRGFLRSFHIHKHNIGEIVPVDMTVNLIIASAWKVGINKSQNEPLIYHNVSGDANPISWKGYFDLCEINAKKFPLDDVFWYPRIRYRKTALATNIDAFFTQRIPAYLIDFASIIMGKKPKMVRLQDKMYHGYNCVKFASTSPVKFESKNYEKLIESMNPNDVKEFDFDVRKINWNQYIEDYFLGARKYLWNSTSTDFAAGRKKIQMLKYANFCLVGTTLAGSLFLLNKLRNSLKCEEEGKEIEQLKPKLLNIPVWQWKQRQEVH
ncbi:hypothetical protein PVAND_001057 [Polypedilum vanderplanki]|uniref:Fatty acyl-CoA reductase n=1 Tax=Polypedilum vanderplanki TaxID=319348 RepID=A0A9J6BN12_POLVA|nr:hypothetical protein PVAND_001057 [Polypedilum vanderplanki]